MPMSSVVKAVCALLFVFGVGVSGCGFAEPPFFSRSSETIADEITTEQNRVLSHCEKRLLAGHPYFKKFETDIEIQNLQRKLTGSREFWSEGFHEAYWQNVVKNGEDMRGFSVLLNIDTEAIPKMGRTNSQTMPATKILNHVFDGLRELGYECRGTPGCTVSGIQYVTNTWELDRTVGGRRDLITVKGEVFLAPRDEQAIVLGTIRYRMGT